MIIKNTAISRKKIKNISFRQPVYSLRRIKIMKSNVESWNIESNSHELKNYYTCKKCRNVCLKECCIVSGVGMSGQQFLPCAMM